MNKPTIRFGYRSDIIDSNFYRYEIQDRIDFIRSHFRNGKDFEVLPYIDNNDTTLTFILKKSSIPIDLQTSTYLLLKIENEYSFWRITSKNTIFNQDILYIKFNCKRDLFTEYFVLKENSLNLLTNLYILRSNAFKPTLENLRICSNACLNDNDFRFVNESKIDVSPGKKVEGLFYEFQLSSSATMNNILRQFKRFYFYLHNKLKDQIKEDGKTTYKNVVVNKFIEVNIRDYENKTGSIAVWRQYGTAKTNGEWWDSNRNGYLRNLRPVFCPTVWQDSNKRLYQHYDNHILVSTANKTIWDRSEESGRFDYKLLFPEIVNVEVKWNPVLELYSVFDLDISDTELRFFYMYNGGEDGKNPNPFYRIPKHNYLSKLSTSFQLYLPKTLKDYNDDFGFDDNDIIEQPTDINGVKNSFIFQVFETAKEFYGLYGFEKELYKNAYLNALDDFVAYLAATNNITINKLTSLVGSNIVSSKNVTSGIYLVNVEDNGNLSTTSPYTILNWKFIDSISDNVDSNIIYFGKQPTNHYDATHSKKFLYGNKVGVFKIASENDYAAMNVDGKSLIVYNTSLSHLNEVATINENYDNVGFVANKRLTLEKQVERFRLNSEYNRTILNNKINNLRKQNNFQKSLNRQQKINNIIKNIGSTALTTGLASQFGTSGAIASSMINNSMWSLFDQKINEELLDYKTNQEILNLQQDHKLNSQHQKDMFNLEINSELAVSAHLTNTAQNKFPWKKQDDIFISDVEFGDKEKIELERLEYGDFINNYHSINEEKLPNEFFIMIDAGKSFNLSLPGLTQLETELIKQILENGAKIIFDRWIKVIPE